MVSEIRTRGVGSYEEGRSLTPLPLRLPWPDEVLEFLRHERDVVAPAELAAGRGRALQRQRPRQASTPWFAMAQMTREWSRLWKSWHEPGGGADLDEGHMAAPRRLGSRTPAR